MNNFFQILKQRITTESPTFFKYITKAGLIFIGIGTSFLALNQMPGFTVPFNLAQYASYLIVFGTAISAVSKLTCKDSDDKDKNSETK